jgi:uncharacterized RDD family membrane protein YckC
MENSFTETMSKRTNEELIKIVTVERDGYQQTAIDAAEKEIEKRNIDINKIEELKTVYTKLADEQKEIESNKVTPWTRFLHFIIDTVAWLIVAVIIGFLFDPLLTGSNQDFLGYSLLAVSFFGYYVFMETKYQKTIAKFITKTKVIMTDGKKPNGVDIMRRTACRLIPFDRVSYFFTPNGFHDYLSNTTVVKDKI